MIEWKLNFSTLQNIHTYINTKKNQQYRNKDLTSLVIRTLDMMIITTSLYSCNKVGKRIQDFDLSFGFSVLLVISGDSWCKLATLDDTTLIGTLNGCAYYVGLLKLYLSLIAFVVNLSAIHRFISFLFFFCILKLFIHLPRFNHRHQKCFDLLQNCKILRKM